ncbi:MAG: LamG domain-containing protein [Nitrospiraceae bacterium]|nr:MAG: LamG domain-containing protein [Nitrospiraceae bacterium]
MLMKKLLYLLAVIFVLSLSITGLSFGGDYALYFPASEVSTDDYNHWFSLVSLADPRTNPAGFDFKDTSITVEAWIKPEKEMGVIAAGGNISARKTTDGFALYLWKGASSTSQEGCASSGESHCVKFAVRSNDTWYIATALIPKALSNEWHHVAGAFDKGAGTLTVYVDGKALPGADSNHLNSITGVPAMADSGSTFIGLNQTFVPEIGIGSVNKNNEIIPKPVHWFKGTIDEIRLWREARSQSQIESCMKKELGTSGDCKITNTLATYLKFNEGSGATVHDTSGHGNNGSSRYYLMSKKVTKDHNVRVGYHTQVQDPESLEIQDPANWVPGYSLSK